MSSFTEAADAIRRIARMTEGFQLAAKALDDIGSFDNAAKEAKAAAAAAIEGRDAALLAHGKIKAAIVETLAKHEESLLLAQGGAEKITSDAEQEGVAAAALIVADARKQAYEMTVAASGDVKNLNGVFAKLKAEVLTLTSSEQSLSASIVEKQKQLDSLTNALDKLKAKLG